MALAATHKDIAALELAQGEIRFYQEEGYLLIPGLLSAPFAQELRDEVMAIVQQIGMLRDRSGRLRGAAGKLVQTQQYLKGGAVDALVNSDELAHLAGQLMGGSAMLYLPFTAVKGAGGGGRFHFHQDNQYTHFDGPGINLWCALSPMHPENGCLQIVPRSHQLGTLEATDSGDGDTHRRLTVEPSRFLPLRMQPGDCVAFSRLTVHGSGVNSSDEVRVAYAVQFARHDASAFFDGRWAPLAERPRFDPRPVTELVEPDADRDEEG